MNLLGDIRSTPDEILLPPVVTVEGLSIAAADGRELLCDTSFQAMPGRLLALVGSSGSGKTTVLRSLLGLLPPDTTRTAGRVAVLDRDVFGLDSRELRELRRTRIAFVGQDPGSSLNPRMRVRTLIRELAADSAAVSTLLQEVRLPVDRDFGARHPGALSGGQQRRVALARALARRPDLLLLDEPTAGLHPALRDEIGDLLVELARERGLAIVFACHDADLVRRIADDVVDLAVALPLAAPVGALRLLPAESGPTGLGSIETNSTETTSAIAFEMNQVGHPSAAQCVPSIAEPAAAGTSEAAKAIVSQPEPRLSVAGLGVEFGGTRVLHDIDLAVAAGASIGIIGPSGSGKTSIARALVGLHPPGSGAIALDGRPLRAVLHRRNREERRRIQLVPQNPLGALNPSHTVESTVGRPLRLHDRRTGRQVPDRVVELLEQVGLGAEFRHRYPHELSGGQRQRVSIARALAAEPDVLICDEVTSALDGRTAAAIMELLSGLRARHHLALVLIAHDLPLIAEHTDTVVVLDAGRVVESGRTASLFADPAHAITRSMLTGPRFGESVS